MGDIYAVSHMITKWRVRIYIKQDGGILKSIYNKLLII